MKTAVAGGSRDLTPASESSYRHISDGGVFKLYLSGNSTCLKMKLAFALSEVYSMIVIIVCKTWRKNKLTECTKHGNEKHNHRFYMVW